MSTQARTVLVANPGLDVYGSDLQLLQSVTALAEEWRVVVSTPTPGPLGDRLRAAGAEVHQLDYPVLRRADIGGLATGRLAARAARALPGMVRAIERVAPDVVYVNTVTLPWWLLAARLARRRMAGRRSSRAPIRVLCHVHETETADRPAVRRALLAPLRLADVVVLNSHTCLAANLAVRPALADRARVVCNGVPGPAHQPDPPRWDGGLRLVTVGRLSPRKAPHVSLAVLAELRARGWDATLDLCGSPAPGQEAYVRRLHARATEPDLDGAVRFRGYEDTVWPALERSHVFLAPSTGESFGNAVVEAQLAARPVVATDVPGHDETVQHGRTGLLTRVGDASALADAVERLVVDHDLAERLARAGRDRAQGLYHPDRYRDEMRSLLDELTAGVTGRRPVRGGH